MLFRSECSIVSSCSDASTGRTNHLIGVLHADPNVGGEDLYCQETQSLKEVAQA